MDKVCNLKSFKTVFVLQAAVCFETFATVFSKKAAMFDAYAFWNFCVELLSGKSPDFSLHNVGFGLFVILQLVVLGIYAIIWQQIIKRIDLSVAYINRGVSLLWSCLWAVLIFDESITFMNVLGVAVILLGTYLVNSDA